MAKRIFQALVLFFAIYAFAFVPLGKKTALDHVRAILGTPAAQDAATEVKGGVERLVRRLKSDARESTEKADQVLAADAELESPDRESPGRANQKQKASRLAPPENIDDAASKPAASRPTSR